MTDKDLLEIVEMEVRELLTKYEFDGDNAAVIKGSATCALGTGDQSSGFSMKEIGDLLNAMDEKLPQPPRSVDKPFLLSIETVF
jgi:elongation factor Tu